MSREKRDENLGEKLAERHERWLRLYQNGGQDPFHADGVNLNLVRNHIINYRRQIEETMSLDEYPPAYQSAVPPKVDDGYMARKAEILENAKRALSEYTRNEDYQYILIHQNDFTEKTKWNLHIDNALRHVTGLRIAIDSGDYVLMRRYENSSWHTDAFRNVANAMKKAPVENVQLSLFSAGGGVDSGQDDGENEMSGMTL